MSDERAQERTWIAAARSYGEEFPGGYGWLLNRLADALERHHARHYVPTLGDLVERTDQEGWGPGKIIGGEDGDARVEFGNEFSSVVAWVPIDYLTPISSSALPEVTE